MSIGSRSNDVVVPRTPADAERMSLAQLCDAANALGAEWTCAARGLVPERCAVVDVHCHVGLDLDGSRLTAEELVAQLDAAAVAHATVIALAQPDGYAAENARMRDIAAGSAGRLVALHRIDPGMGDAEAVADDARRGLEAGARGLKWHPRAEAFSMQHPAAAATARVANEAGVPVLIHAGRGMPNLGAAVVDLARENPNATFILAHAAVSDIAWILDATRDVPNVVFDTSWWKPYDLAVLLARVAPGRVVHGSDPPYGTVQFGVQLTARIARACGYNDAAMSDLMGGTAARMLRLGGESQSDPGSPMWGPRSLPVEDADMRRAASYLEAAVLLTILGGGGAAEQLELARHALELPSTHEHARAADVLRGAIVTSEQLLARPATGDGISSTMGLPVHVRTAMELLISTLCHAATPKLGIAGTELLA